MYIIGHHEAQPSRPRRPDHARIVEISGGPQRRAINIPIENNGVGAVPGAPV
jgi:hypothetical protein